MIYGLRNRLHQDRPGDQVGKAKQIRSAARTWEALNSACRLAVIEQALRASNDRFPFAL